MKQTSFLSRALLLTIAILLPGAAPPVVAQKKIPESSVVTNPDDYFELAEGSSLMLDAIGWRLAKPGKDVMADFLLDLRGGLNRAGTYLQPGAPPVEIKEAVRSTAEFIRRRSGVALGETQVERLASMESDFLDGKRRGITIDTLAFVVTGTLFERINSLTDEEIEQAAHSFRVASIHDSPDVIALRMNQTPSGSMRVEDFIIQAKAFRDSSTDLARLQRTLAEKIIRDEIEWRMNLFARSYPERWAKEAHSGVSPVKALVVAYSAISGDTCFSDAALRGTMHALEDAMRKNSKKEIAVERKTAFGPRGFIYSTPLDLLMNDSATNRFLDRLDPESRK
jgi:hypothetical protein